MAKLIERAAKAIGRRLAELVGEQRQLRQALAALAGCSAQSPAEPPKRAPAQAR